MIRSVISFRGGEERNRNEDDDTPTAVLVLTRRHPSRIIIHSSSSSTRGWVFFLPRRRTAERRRARRQAECLAKVLHPTLGGPPGLDAIHALSSTFGGPAGCVTQETMLAMLRIPETVLTRRFYVLLGGRSRRSDHGGGSMQSDGDGTAGGGGGGEGEGTQSPTGGRRQRRSRDGHNTHVRRQARHATLRQFLCALANLRARVPVRTPPAAVSHARSMPEREARLEFAFSLYDLDGDGRVSRAEVTNVVEQTMAGNEKKIASTVRAALRCEAEGNGDGSLDLAAFARVEESAPGFLYPAFSLHEILMEYSAHAATAYSLLMSSPSRGGGRYAPGEDFADDERAETVGPDGYRVGRGGAGASSSSRRGDGGGVGDGELDPGEVTSRFAAMSTRQLKAHLVQRGMDYSGCVDKLELVDLAVASALSTGEPPPPPPPIPGRVPQDGDVAAAVSAAVSAAETAEVEAANAAAAARRAAAAVDGGGGGTPRGKTPRRTPRTPRSQAASVADHFSEQAKAIIADAFRAARMGRATDIDDMVREKEIGVDTRDPESGATLLMTAAAHGGKSLCKKLLHLGADPKLVDKQGRTALDLALKYNHFTVADFLRRQGVPHAGDNDWTPPPSGGGGGGGGSVYDGSFYAAGAAVGAAGYMSRMAREMASAPPPEYDATTPSAPPVATLSPSSRIRDHSASRLVFGNPSEVSGGWTEGSGGGGGVDTSGDEALARRLATEEFVAAQMDGNEGVHGAGPPTPSWAHGGVGGSGGLMDTVEESPMSDTSDRSAPEDEGPLLRPD